MVPLCWKENMNTLLCLISERTVPQAAGNLIISLEFLLQKKKKKSFTCWRPRTPYHKSPTYTSLETPHFSLEGPILRWKPPHPHPWNAALLFYITNPIPPSNSTCLYNPPISLETSFLSLSRNLYPLNPSLQIEETSPPTTSILPPSLAAACEVMPSQAPHSFN